MKIYGSQQTGDTKPNRKRSQASMRSGHQVGYLARQTCIAVPDQYNRSSENYKDQDTYDHIEDVPIIVFKDITARRSQ